VSIKIRHWHQDDIEMVRLLLWETWKESYSSFIPMDDLSAYFHEHCTSAILLAQCNDKNVCGYIAECDEIIAGYEKTTYNKTENRFYVQQLYVLPVFQNLGLGKKLMKSAAELAKSLGLDKVWVGVMMKNESAVSWYQFMGYEIVETAPFTMGKTTVDHYIGYIPVEKILRSPKTTL
jgi:ribosomal protein S18 acetylase RimI-like enzyme